MEIQKFIAVPVDFSPESHHAIRYARMFASHLKMGITIVHVHLPLPDPVTGSAYDVEMMRIHENRLNKLLAQVREDESRNKIPVPVDSCFDVGDVQSHLSELAAGDKYDMVMMSTEAKNSYLKRILGSVSTQVGRHSPKPAIIVPIGAPLKFPENIVIGISEELLRDDAIEFLLDLVSDSNVFLDFVHISNDLSAYDLLMDELSEKIKAYNKGHIHYTISRVPYANETIDQALTDYVNIKRADLVVLTTHHRSFIESMGHRSITKKMLLDPALPILVLHGYPEKGLGLTNELYNMIKEG